MLLTQSKGALIIALSLLVPPTIGTYSIASAGEDFVQSRQLGQYDPETHKAVQQALRDKGYYSGAIDGRVGPMTRKAYLKFRSDRGISRPPSGALKLDDAVARELFGLQNSGIASWDDEWCLLGRLGRLGDRSMAPEGCTVSTADAASVEEPEPQPDQR